MALVITFGKTLEHNLCLDLPFQIYRQYEETKGRMHIFSSSVSFHYPAFLLVVAIFLYLLSDRSSGSKQEIYFSNGTGVASYKAGNLVAYKAGHLAANKATHPSIWVCQ